MIKRIKRDQIRDTTQGYDVVEVERSVMSKKQKERYPVGTAKIPFRFLTRYQKQIIKGKSSDVYLKT